MRTAAVAVVSAAAGAYGTLRLIEWAFGWYVRQAVKAPAPT